MADAPKRACRFVLDLLAYTRDDRASALFNRASQIERGELTQGVSGGYSSGYIYELTESDRPTHDEWAQNLRAYLDQRKPNTCKLTECQGKPRCKPCLAMDAAYGVAPLVRSLRLSDPEAAEDVRKLRDELVADPKKATDLLKRAGILTAEGDLAPEFGGEPAGAQEGGPTVTVQTLRQHWLRAMECDHATGRDKPHCACSRVDLGWHPSVGEAVEAWLAHVSGVGVPAEGRQK
jgi:hypothetical protein